MKCPVDGNELEKSVVKGLDVWHCPSCSGVFFILDANPSMVLSTGSLKPDQRKQVPVSALGAKKSPINGKPMKVFRYRGIQIDYCQESSGVWLDGDELALLKANEMKPRTNKGRKSWYSKMFDSNQPDLADIVFRSILGIIWDE